MIQTITNTETLHLFESHKAIETIISEHKNAELLAKYGLRPVSKILLQGNDEELKLNMALKVAKELDKTLFKIDISHLLGSTDMSEELLIILKKIENESYSNQVIFFNFFYPIHPESKSWEMMYMLTELLKGINDKIFFFSVDGLNYTSQLSTRFDKTICIRTNPNTLGTLNFYLADIEHNIDTQNVVDHFSYMTIKELKNICEIAKKKAVLTNTPLTKQFLNKTIDEYHRRATTF